MIAVDRAAVSRISVVSIITSEDSVTSRRYVTPLALAQLQSCCECGKIQHVPIACGSQRRRHAAGCPKLLRYRLTLFATFFVERKMLAVW